MKSNDTEKVMIKFEFPLNVPTRNMYIYTTECMKKAIETKHIQWALKNKSLFGTISRPRKNLWSLYEIAQVSIADAAFGIDSLNITESGDKLIGDIHILDTPVGNVLRDRINDGISFSLAPRGFGSVDVNGVIQDNFKLISFDLINKFDAKFHYDFHHKYMPLQEYHARDYDGDEDRHPLDMMDEYWYPVIEMVNHTDYNNKFILNYLKENSINPFSVSSVKEEGGIIKVELHQFQDDNKKDVESRYFLWVIDQINTSNVPACEILSDITTKGTPLWIVGSISPGENTKSGYSVKIGLSTEYGCSNGNRMELYINAAKARKSAILRKSQMSNKLRSRGNSTSLVYYDEILYLGNFPINEENRNDKEITVLDVVKLSPDSSRFIIDVQRSWRGKYPFPNGIQDWTKDELMKRTEDLIMINNALVLEISPTQDQYGDALVLIIDAEEMLS